MAHAKPDLAIVSSLYRAEPYYHRFVRRLKSVHAELAEKDISCEHVLVVNDATSADRQAVSEIESALTPHEKAAARSIYVPRESLYASWNRGVRASQADCFAFWNADDERSSEAMLEGIERIASGARLVYFDFVSETPGKGKSAYERRQEEMPPFDPYRYSREMWFNSFFMFARGLYEEIGGFDEQFQIAGDFDWCIRAMEATDRIEKGCALGGVFANYGEGLSTSRFERVYREFYWIRFRYQETDFLAPWERLKPGEFRCDMLRDAEAPEGWRPLPEHLRQPIVPTPEGIEWFLGRGRFLFRLWTRLRWFCMPRYNLKKVRARLLRERETAGA